MATITLNLPTASLTRLKAALTETLELTVPATGEDCKNYIITDLKQLVRSSERRAAAKAVVDEVPLDVT